MRTIDACQYLQARKLAATHQMECANPYCPEKVRLADAVAYPARFDDGQARMAFFCSEVCITVAISAGRC